MSTPDQLDPTSIATLIHTHFRSYRDEFETITAAAQLRFTDADWSGVQNAGAQRLAIYNAHINAVLEEVLFPSPPDAITSWSRVKADYAKLIDHTADAELAQTFFNSVYRKHTHDGPVVADEMFLHDENVRIKPPQRPVLRRFNLSVDRFMAIRDLLNSFSLGLPWRDLDADAHNILKSLEEEPLQLAASGDFTIDMVVAPFFRNKAVYLIGRLQHAGQIWPVALPVLQTADGKLYVDTLICDADELSVLFSFTRAYFMVNTAHPSTLVEFLQTLLPAKKRSELYAGIGLHKHGKTEFYRGFLAHLDASCDQFIIAPGIKGMVMAVFMLPSYQTVFKVIKDRFAPQKNVTAAEVVAKYHVVKTHDRVGRMADTQEFTNFRFPKARLAPDLLDELIAVCRSSIVDDGDHLIIRHLYTERQMIPLNIYFDSCTETELVSALDEYGNAITQLAAANIFPGDMLSKNFGVTRHGRVVFYDYDEIEYLNRLNFRDGPAPAYHDERDHDVYPEEFRRFLPDKRRIREIFAQLHPQLFTGEFWRALQSTVSRGEVSDVFPYRRKKRFITVPAEETDA